MSKWNFTGLAASQSLHTSNAASLHQAHLVFNKQGKRELIMTAEQAKQVKVQKGYVLEPVLNAGMDEENLPEKRERKKSNHFGVCIQIRHCLHTLWPGVRYDCKPDTLPAC